MRNAPAKSGGVPMSEVAQFHRDGLPEKIFRRCACAGRSLPAIYSLRSHTMLFRLSSPELKTPYTVAAASSSAEGSVTSKTADHSANV